MRSFSLLLLVVVLLLSCSREPAMVRQARKAELAGALSRAFLKSVEAEKSAVLATTDEESERFASESRDAAREVGRLQRDLEVLIGGDARQPEKDRLAAFSAAWAKVAAIDAQLLPLAVANTNLKAAHLSSHEAAAALERLVARLGALEARSKDPARIRRLSAAAVAALTIQTLHPPHIVSPDDAEMKALEGRIEALSEKVDEVLKGELKGEGGEGAGPEQGEALAAWRDYQGTTTEVLRLSRQNTNVLSFSMSVHEKRDASVAAEVALLALISEVEVTGPRATR